MPERIEVHPDFDKLSYENDIALIKLNSPLVFSKHIIPVCISQSTASGKWGNLIGWGSTEEDGPLSNTLQYAELQILTNHHCEKMFNQSRHFQYISSSFLCAGDDSGQIDSCIGDSGAPFVVQINGVWYLYGIVSWGIGSICAEPGIPTVFTRISTFYDWIKNVTSLHF
ncbi:Trypsin-like serine protease 3 [Dinothrombium tinctorium]|uniref:Trypsin-like serine protease 3 n=1 Tax=Dinothrombium tinctorium TaxID=1965070 RepID=A0A443QX25_9ACAR|nr:Trypsin-like serine protease 3 [Dinothrombium tinctorium]